MLIALVTEMGLMSFSTVVTEKCFGSGVTLDIFQLSGTTPCRRDELTIAQIGVVSVRDNCRKILFGKRSGPGDFRWFNLVKTS